MGIGVGANCLENLKRPEYRCLKEARTNEALEIMRRLFTEDDVHFDGEFNQLSA